jgi:hypothetical protein
MNQVMIKVKFSPETAPNNSDAILVTGMQFFDCTSLRRIPFLRIA